MSELKVFAEILREAINRANPQARNESLPSAILVLLAAEAAIEKTMEEK